MIFRSGARDVPRSINGGSSGSREGLGVQIRSTCADCVGCVGKTGGNVGRGGLLRVFLPLKLRPDSFPRRLLAAYSDCNSRQKRVIRGAHAGRVLRPTRIGRSTRGVLGRIRGLSTLLRGCL